MQKGDGAFVLICIKKASHYLEKVTAGPIAKLI